jgi:hypothetical protein
MLHVIRPSFEVVKEGRILQVRDHVCYHYSFPNPDSPKVLFLLMLAQIMIELYSKWLLSSIAS